MRCNEVRAGLTRALDEWSRRFPPSAAFHLAGCTGCRAYYRSIARLN